MATKRLMVIVWKWRHLDNVVPIIPIDNVKNLHDIWHVNNVAKDLLIRFDPDLEGGGNPTDLEIENSIKYLDDLIAQYIEEYNIQLFLHISHRYNEKNVKYFNERGDRVRCILFGGRDHIYISSRNARGLLGKDGNMYSLLTNRPRVDAIEDIENRLIQRYHFDNVWHYYQHLFNRKTLELKEALLRIYLPNIYLDEPATKNKSIEANFRKNMAEYKVIDLHYYQDQSGIIGCFNALCAEIDTFERLLKDKKIPTLQIITNLRNAFNHLLNSLPEDTYA